MEDFHEYYSGKKTAPIMTLFIGGNHEASNHLWELYELINIVKIKLSDIFILLRYYGGWVAKNIYFLGYSGVIWFGGLRIAGLSGIYYHLDVHKSNIYIIGLICKFFFFF